jgi:hypothetical protein
MSFILTPERRLAYAMINKVPGKELSPISLPVDIEIRVEVDLPKGAFPISPALMNGE